MDEPLPSPADSAIATTPSLALKPLSSPALDISALPVDLPPTETTSVHLLLTSRIGWIAWQEKESSVIRYFTHSFNAIRCELKFGEKATEFIFELELDKKGMAQFEKFYKSKAIARDLDRIHGLFPALGGKEDLIRMKTSQGTGLFISQDPSTLLQPLLTSAFESPLAMTALTTRIASLEQAQTRCFDELYAIKQQWSAQMQLMTDRLDAIETRLASKVSHGVGDKLDGVHAFLMAYLEMELTGVPMNADTSQIAEFI